MTKEEKVLVIQEIKELLQDAKAVYVADLEGLNASQTSDFRRQAFKNNVQLRVVKNTLLQKAMEQIEGIDYSEMFETFKGNSTLMIADTANAPAKLIQGFRKNAEKPALKSAYLQETFYIGDNQLSALANIKSREEMIGEIIGLLQSPIQRVVSALQNKPETVEAKAEEAAAPAVEETVAPEAAAESTDAPEASAE
ncbi:MULTISPECIES: 50S ribosomal protein L10 [Elizabethkingia]|jgi:large subunit ribosomal protein L10|uniref:Large ribosomal subunit protein uL10 n=1 Tax=Elizabethkingia ursingii TaxID=1756150 RepID=A0AAJ3NBG6_9FLAO|nr:MULTISPECIES: 50S ribosomal protein L10 [Elizabethkingia]AJW63692.1 50S ribosomal protein L10 [Elizabethkingia miricola]AQX09174.1 50S ribosomal protein L10 [Elizabethkingia ursingii]KUY25580.1 50S ribosomal protein L10 [Elizabethkingia ursingii]MCL1667932.1 50S ribosomal protein L10 [Elizabethkingia ursingii]MCL1670223.1 50S ribosomal protein L10 [Elizabethkingia ursingii]